MLSQMTKVSPFKSTYILCTYLPWTYIPCQTFGCFVVLTTTDSVAMTTGVQMSFQDPDSKSFGCVPGSVISLLMWQFYFNFLRKLYIVLAICYPNNNIQRFIF